MKTANLLLFLLILLEGIGCCDSLPSSYQVAGFFPRSAVLTRSNRMHLKNRRLLEARRAEKKKQEKIYWFRRMEAINALLSEDVPNRKNQSLFVYWKLGKELTQCPFADKDRSFIPEVSEMLKIPENQLREYRSFFSCFGKISPYLNWASYEILLKVENEKERLYYHQAIHFYSWDTQELNEKIQLGFYRQMTSEEREKVLKSFVVLIDPNEVIEALIKSRENTTSSCLIRHFLIPEGFSRSSDLEEDEIEDPVVYRV